MTTDPKYFTWIKLHHIQLYIISMAVAHPGWLTAHPKIWKIKFLEPPQKKSVVLHWTTATTENDILLYNRVFWPGSSTLGKVGIMPHMTQQNNNEMRQKQGSTMQARFALGWAMILWVYVVEPSVRYIQLDHNNRYKWFDECIVAAF